MHQKGASVCGIARITGKDHHTVKKYPEGDPYNLCRSNKQGALDAFKGFIAKAIRDGKTQSCIARKLKKMGYGGTASNAGRYIRFVAREYGLGMVKYSNSYPETKDVAAKGKKPQFDYVTRKGIFNLFWMGLELTQWHHGQQWQR